MSGKIGGGVGGVVGGGVGGVKKVAQSESNVSRRSDAEKRILRTTRSTSTASVIANLPSTGSSSSSANKLSLNHSSPTDRDRDLSPSDPPSLPSVSPRSKSKLSSDGHHIYHHSNQIHHQGSGGGGGGGGSGSGSHPNLSTGSPINHSGGNIIVIIIIIIIIIMLIVITTSTWDIPKHLGQTIRTSLPPFIIQTAMGAVGVVEAGEVVEVEEAAAGEVEGALVVSTFLLLLLYMAVEVEVGCTEVTALLTLVAETINPINLLINPPITLPIILSLLTNFSFPTNLLLQITSSNPLTPLLITIFQ